MHKSVSLDLQILPAEKSSIAALSSAALYGKGVFTSLAIYDSRPFLWAKHWRRLRENSAKLGIDLSSFDEETVETALLQLIAHNNFQTGRARLRFLTNLRAKSGTPARKTRQIFYLRPQLFRKRRMNLF